MALRWKENVENATDATLATGMNNVKLNQNITLLKAMKKMENQLYKKMDDEQDDIFINKEGITH